MDRLKEHMSSIEGKAQPPQSCLVKFPKIAPLHLHRTASEPSIVTGHQPLPAGGEFRHAQIERAVVNESFEVSQVGPVEYFHALRNLSLVHPLNRQYLMDESEIAIVQVGVARTGIGMGVR